MTWSLIIRKSICYNLRKSSAKVPDRKAARFNPLSTNTSTLFPPEHGND